MNRPVEAEAVAAEVAASVAAYDTALYAGDLDGVNGWFWVDPQVSRFGERGVVRGHDAIAAARRSGAAPSAPKAGEVQHVIVLSADAAVATLEYVRPSTGRRGRRTQVWRRTPEGWRIAHAHLSLEA